MRPIDGDALKERYENHRKLYCKNRIEFKLLSEKDKARVDELDNCIADILNAPTIEPERKKGHWEITEAYPHNVYCSNCHRIFAQTHWTVWEDGSLSRNFCPNCGSYNGGGQDESD